MKRIVSMALCALLLLGTAPAVRAQEDAVAIGSREDMLKIAADPAGTYELTADIDMGGEPWTPIPFSGVLKGNGHGLYNLTVLVPGEETAATYDGNHREFDTVFGGLFSVVRDAKIRDLALVDAVVDIGTDRHCFVGALAGYAAGSDISGCSVTARNHLTVSSVNAGVAGVVGFSVDNRITDCATCPPPQITSFFLPGIHSRKIFSSPFSWIPLIPGARPRIRSAVSGEKPSSRQISCLPSAVSSNSAPLPAAAPQRIQAAILGLSAFPPAKR